MSIGFGVDDIAALVNLARTVYKKCRDSPGQYKELAADVLQHANVLDDLNDLVKECRLEPSKERRLLEYGDACRVTLEDANRLLDKYKNMPSRAKRVVDRLGWDYEDARDVRGRIIDNKASLSAFYSSLTMSEFVQVQKNLVSYLDEVCQGYRDPDSVVLIATHKDSNEERAWPVLVRELEDFSLTSDVVNRNRQVIFQLIRTAFDDGRLRNITTGEDDLSRALENVSLSQANNNDAAVTDVNTNSQDLENPGFATLDPPPYINSSFYQEVVREPTALTNTHKGDEGENKAEADEEPRREDELREHMARASSSMGRAPPPYTFGPSRTPVRTSPEAKECWPPAPLEAANFIATPGGAASLLIACTEGIWRQGAATKRDLVGFFDMLEYMVSSKDGKFIAGKSDTSSKSRIKAFDADTGKRLGQIEALTYSSETMSFSPRESQLLAFSDYHRLTGKRLVIWNVLEDKVRAECWTVHQNTITSVKFSADGNLLGSASEDGSVKIWDPNTGDLIHKWTGLNPVSALAFPPDDLFLTFPQEFTMSKARSLITITNQGIHTKGSEWKSVEIATGERVTTLLWSLDGQMLASGLSAGTLAIWHFTNGEPGETRFLKGHKKKVLSLSFSSCGSLLASTSNDITIRLWNTNEAILLAEVTGLDLGGSPVVMVRFSPDDRRLMAGDLRGRIRFWEVERHLGGYVLRKVKV